MQFSQHMCRNKLCQHRLQGTGFSLHANTLNATNANNPRINCFSLLKIPEPSAIRGKNIYLIEPEPEVAVPILLRKLRETRKLTQGDIAKVLGISYQAYQRLEKPGKSNPTLKTLERLAKVFNKDLRLEFA